MARPAAVSEREVIEAGRDLLAEGDVVTGWALRRVLGRGRPDRLYEVWTKRDLLQDGQEADFPKRGLPESVRAKFEQELTQGARRAVVSLDAVLEVHFSEFVRKHVEATQEALRGTSALIERLEVEVAEGEERLARAEQVVAGLRTELSGVREMLEAARQAEAARDATAASLRAESDRLTAELASMGTRLEDAAARAASEGQRATEAEARARDALERAARAEGALDALRGLSTVAPKESTVAPTDRKRGAAHAP